MEPAACTDPLSRSRLPARRRAAACAARPPSPHPLPTPPARLASCQGYGLFEVTASDELAQGSDAVQRSVENMERFGKVVKLAAFKPFTSAANALEQINAVSESQVGSAPAVPAGDCSSWVLSARASRPTCGAAVDAWRHGVVAARATADTMGLPHRFWRGRAVPQRGVRSAQAVVHAAGRPPLMLPSLRCSARCGLKSSRSSPAAAPPVNAHTSGGACFG